MRAVRPVALASVLLIAGITPFAAAQSGQQDRIGQLENRVEQLERRLGALQKQVEASLPPSPAEEQKANALLGEIQGLAQKGDIDAAKKKLDELNKDYSGTQAQRRAGRLNQEFSVIGKPAPTKYEIEKWYQGKSDVTLDNSKTTLLVFWEEWCPHCQREVPKMQKIHDDYAAKGLQVVGLTKITRSATEEKVLKFMADRKVTYPVAKETGGISQYFNVSGIPAAAVVKDGKVVWRGHPGSINDAMLKEWTGS